MPVFEIKVFRRRPVNVDVRCLQAKMRLALSAIVGLITLGHLPACRLESKTDLRRSTTLVETRGEEQVRIYDLAELTRTPLDDDHADHLQGMISEIVAPDAWRGSTGFTRVRFVNEGDLLVQAPTHAHATVSNLLAQVFHRSRVPLHRPDISDIASTIASDAEQPLIIYHIDRFQSSPNPDVSELPARLAAQIESGSWALNGGQNTAEAFGSKLLVRAPPSVQSKVAALLLAVYQ